MSEVLQRVILQAAAEREDGHVVVSQAFDPQAVRDAIEDLLAAGWLQTVPASEGMPALKTASGQDVAFQITSVGRAEAARLSQARRLEEIRSRMEAVKKDRAPR